MILARLDNVTAYRMHAPKWAVAPTSGAGAAKHGGRVNRPGVEALYLALEAGTAIQEYQQISTLLPPGTLTSYKLTAEPVVDFGKATSRRPGSRIGRTSTAIGVSYGSTSVSSRQAGSSAMPSSSQVPRAFCSRRNCPMGVRTWFYIPRRLPTLTRLSFTIPVRRCRKIRTLGCDVGDPNAKLALAATSVSAVALW
jgi:Uncharacterized conserved protein